MRFSFAWYTSLLGARKKINVLGFLTDENKSVLVSLVLFLPVTQTPRVRFPDMEDSLFFLFLIVGAVCLLKMHQLNDTLPEWLRGSPAK